jgi:hypothetical protein
MNRIMNNVVDFYATQAHYFAHLLPIWRALPAESRGTFYVSGHARSFAAAVDGHKGAPRGSGLTAVAAFGDLVIARQRGPVIFLEHGAGQTYDFGDGSRHPSYSGGEDRGGVVLFICPNYEAAARNAQVYPDTPAVAVGSPKLDQWHQRKARGELEPYDTSTGGGNRPTVAVSFHWDCRLVPESRWAFPHYRRMLERSLLQRSEFEVIGHGHPRARGLPEFWKSIGVEYIADFDEVLERAVVYVCDNSSTLFEFASVKGRVVVLNAPWYRRDVDHGLRFWDAAGIGLQCDNPADFFSAIVTSLAMSDAEVARITEPHLRRIYHVRDGTAASRGAHSIADLVLAKGRIDDGQPQVSRR